MHATAALHVCPLCYAAKRLPRMRLLRNPAPPSPPSCLASLRAHPLATLPHPHPADLPLLQTDFIEGSIRASPELEEKVFDHIAEAFTLNRSLISWEQVRRGGREGRGAQKRAVLQHHFRARNCQPPLASSLLSQVDDLIDASNGQYLLLDALNYLSDVPKSLYRHNGGWAGYRLPPSARTPLLPLSPFLTSPPCPPQFKSPQS